VSTSNGEVVLDLHQLVTDLGSQLGLSSQVSAAQSQLSGSTGATARGTVKQKLGITIPATTGRIVIMKTKQLRTAQNIAKAIRGMAIVLPAIALALFALAVYLAVGWRRLCLRTAGWCFFGIGAALLLVRRVAGDQVINGLAVVPADKSAAEA